MDRDPQFKRPYYVVNDYGQGSVVCIVVARSREEILKRYPMYEVLESLPEFYNDSLLRVWHRTAKDIDDDKLTEYNLFD